MTAKRGKIILVAIVLALYVLIVPVAIMQRTAAKEVEDLKTKYKELTVLGDEYRALKGQVDVVERKGVLKQQGGIANAIDGLAASVGIKGKVKSIKGIGSRELKDSMSEESAEVRLEKVNMNELVNIFYKIGDAPMLLSIKQTQVKKSFENPELFDVNMSLSLFTKK